MSMTFYISSPDFDWEHDGNHILLDTTTSEVRDRSQGCHYLDDFFDGLCTFDALFHLQSSHQLYFFAVLIRNASQCAVSLLFGTAEMEIAPRTEPRRRRNAV